MFYKHLDQLCLLLVIFLAISLTGCAGENHFNPFSDTSAVHSADGQDADGGEDPDLSLEDAEPQGSLEQELAADAKRVRKWLEQAATQRLAAAVQGAGG